MWEKERILCISCTAMKSHVIHPLCIKWHIETARKTQCECMNQTAWVWIPKQSDSSTAKKKNEVLHNFRGCSAIWAIQNTWITSHRIACDLKKRRQIPIIITCSSLQCYSVNRGSIFRAIQKLHCNAAPNRKITCQCRVQYLQYRALPWMIAPIKWVPVIIGRNPPIVLCCNKSQPWTRPIPERWSGIRWATLGTAATLPQ